MTPLRFGILGTGSIAAEVAGALALSARGTAHAVASRSPEKARSFAADHDVPRAHESYAALIADDEIDVVYVAVPHPQHEPLARAAIDAGRHVLCEKPLTVAVPAAESLLERAATRGVLLLEAFAYRFHPQTDALLRTVADGGIGRLRALSVAFSYDAPAGRALAANLAGGGILDVGCYCTSMAGRLVAAAAGAVTAEPLELVAMGELDAVEQTDRVAFALLRYPDDVIAQLSCGVALRQEDHVRVFGSEGWIDVGVPAWLDGHRTAATRVTVHRPSGEAETIAIPGGVHIFAREVDGMAGLLDDGPDAWAPFAADSLANMRTLDRWRAAVGVSFPFEAAA